MCRHTLMSAMVGIARVEEKKLTRLAGEGLDHLVGHSEGGVQEPQPQHGDDHVRYQVGGQHDRAHEGGLGEPLHEDRDGQGEKRLQPDIDDDVLQSHSDGVPEGVVPDHALVVVDAGEGLGVSRLYSVKDR